jgi:hypothetical protein
MQIRPVDFWDMSMEEFFLAIEGFREFHGSAEKTPMTKGELAELMELYPDG